MKTHYDQRRAKGLMISLFILLMLCFAHTRPWAIIASSANESQGLQQVIDELHITQRLIRENLRILHHSQSLFTAQRQHADKIQKFELEKIRVQEQFIHNQQDEQRRQEKQTELQEEIGDAKGEIIKLLNDELSDLKNQSEKFAQIRDQLTLRQNQLEMELSEEKAYQAQTNAKLAALENEIAASFKTGPNR